MTRFTPLRVSGSKQDNSQTEPDLYPSSQSMISRFDTGGFGQVTTVRK